MSKRKKVLLGSVAAALLLPMIVWNVLTMSVTKRVSDEDYRQGNPAYVRREKYQKPKLTTPDRLSELYNEMGFDLRDKDISSFSLASNEADLAQVTYNSSTVWPEDLPANFDPVRIMENGKKPGLGIRELHKQGKTGKNVSIAIIDQGLNLDHSEYGNNILGYELLHYSGNAALHGCAVTSIAVGHTCGVAPGANVYYIASTFGKFTPFGYQYNLKYMADSIDRIVEINELLPEGHKIRAISISQGFEDDAEGQKVIAAIERAKASGIFVLTTTPEPNYGFHIMGLGREFHSDPDDVDSYLPGMWLSDSFYDEDFWCDPETSLAIPMDARTYASFLTTDEYEFCAQGGYSWCVPWLTGLYALCCEQKPDITPDEFIQKAFETGTIRKIEKDGTVYQLGTILNPQKLIEAL